MKICLLPDLATEAIPPILVGMETITEDIALGHSPMRLLGVNLQRSYTVVRHSGAVFIVSPTDSMDIEAIHALGPVPHIIAPTCFHDTGMRTAAKAFPGAKLWGVPGVSKHLPGLKLHELRADQAPEEWSGVLRCIAIDGMPKVNEHVLWHEPSQTLITSDLIFNIQAPVDLWTRLFFQINGAWQRPGMTRIFRAYIKDMERFTQSIQILRQLTIQRILPAHGAPITQPSEITRALTRLQRS